MQSVCRRKWRTKCDSVVDELLSVDELSVDECSVDELSVDGLSVDELSW